MILKKTNLEGNNLVKFSHTFSYDFFYVTITTSNILLEFM